MQIELTSVLVGDQEHAPRFYTDVLGFAKKTNLPAGDGVAGRMGREQRVGGWVRVASVSALDPRV